MNIKTFGLEKEFFITDQEGHLVLSPDSVPHDDCHWLAEARGSPSPDPVVAKHLLNAAIEQLQELASKAGLRLIDAHTAPVPRELMRVARRKYGKSTAKAYFAHGGCYHNDTPRAGLHVHFGNSYDITNKDGNQVTVNGMIDMPRIIWMMDQAFKEEIRAAKRVPGENEIKSWGFEYRSLPSDVNLDKVVSVLRAIKAD